MRKGTTTALLVGLGVIGAVIAFRACSGEGAKATKTAASSASASDATRRTTPGANAAHPLPSASATTEVASPSSPPGDGRVVFFSPWGGSSKDQLGHERLEEGNAMGPMSLATGPGGKIYILDEVNGRIVRRGPDGSLEGTTDMKLLAAQDLAVAKDGSMAVLDRLGDKTVALYDPSGNVRGQLPIEGEGIEEPGYITGLVVDGNDVYVEREHGTLLKIGTTDGTAAEPRTEAPGRPSRDGLSWLNAGIVDGPGGRVIVSSIDRQTGDHRFTRQLKYKSEVQSILLLDTDKHGTIYFAVELHEDPAVDYVMLQCLDPQKGAPIGSTTLPPNTLPEETFRDFSVLDDGGVIYAIRSNDGVTYRRYDCGG